MSALAKAFYTPEQYLEMERASESRHEYHRGEIFAMAGGTEEHNVITQNTATAFRSQLRGRQCRTYTTDMRVWIPSASLFTYPDVAVVCGERRFLNETRDTLLNPSIIVEVLSKSTESYNRNQKFALYKEIPTFTDYLLIAQDRYSVEHFVRQPDGEWTLNTVTDPDGAVAIQSIGCTPRLAEIYDEVEFSQE